MSDTLPQSPKEPLDTKRLRANLNVLHMIATRGYNDLETPFAEIGPLVEMEESHVAKMQMDLDTAIRLIEDMYQFIVDWEYDDE